MLIRVVPAKEDADDIMKESPERGVLATEEVVDEFVSVFVRELDRLRERNKDGW